MKRFMLYLESEIAKETENFIFKVYVTDTLMSIVNNTHNFAGGTKQDKRFVDMIMKKDSEEENAMSAEEIVADVINRANLKVVD